MNPEITVVIPTYKRAGSLPKTLKHILSQTVPIESYRVIVVDNRSLDGTDKVVQRFNKEHPEVSYVLQEKPGAAPTRNEGIARAKTPLVLFMDDDILATPRLIEEHLKGHRNRTCSVLGHLNVSWADSGDPFLRYLQESEDQNTFRYLDPHKVSYQYFYTGNVSCRREAVLAAGGFDEGFSVYGVEDVDLGYRLETLGERMIYRKEALAFHDYHPSYKEYLGKRRNAGRSLAYFLAKYPHLAPEFSFGEHPTWELGVPRALTAWLKPLVVDGSVPGTNKIAPWWFRKAVRWNFYKGYKSYRKFWNESGTEYIPIKSRLVHD